MRTLLLPLRARFIVYTVVLLVTTILLFGFIASLLFGLLSGSALILIAIPLALFAVLSAIGTVDLFQTRHAVLRNYPLTAHIRFILEEIVSKFASIFLRAKKMARRFPVTNARSSISAPSRRWISAHLAPKTTSMLVATSGWTIRWRRECQPGSRFASSSAGRTATTRIRLRSSIFRL